MRGFEYCSQPMSALQIQILPVTPFAQNCSLIWDQDGMHGALVDPGGEPERLLEAAAAAGVQIEKILVTHAHLDHVGAVAQLAEQLQVPIEGPHPDDQFWIDLLPMQAQQFGFPPSRSFKPDRWLGDGDELCVGSVRFQVIHCPGHTPGHVVFYQPDQALALVGDVLFQGSIGRTDFPRGNQADLIHSIRHKLFPLGDEIRFIPGHGPMSTFGAERRSNPFVSDPRYG